MYKRRATIINQIGLHARPASDFINEAKKFKSKITITNLNEPDDGTVNAKSIIAVLSLAVPQGSTIEISAEGEDETAAVDSLSNLVETGFGE